MKLQAMMIKMKGEISRLEADSVFRLVILQANILFMKEMATTQMKEKMEDKDDPGLKKS